MVDGQLQEHSTVTLQSASTVSPITPNESTTVWWTPSTTQLNSGSLGKYGSATPVTENESTTIWWTPAPKSHLQPPLARLWIPPHKSDTGSNTKSSGGSSDTKSVWIATTGSDFASQSNSDSSSTASRNSSSSASRQAVIIGSKDLTWKKTLLCGGVIGVSLLLNLL